MPAPSAAVLEEIELAVCREVVAAAPPDLAAGLGLRFVAFGRAGALVAVNADVPVLNRALGLGVLAPAEPDSIDALTAPWGGAEVRYLVQVAAEAETDLLRAALEARRLRRLDAWAKVWRGVEPAPTVATDLRIGLVDAGAADELGRVLCAGYGMPPPMGALFAALVARPGWHAYLARDGDEPAATGALFVQGDIGWLGFAATLPSHRRRGAQGALMARRIADGLALGCRCFVTEAEEDRPGAPNPSYHNMLRTGFQLAYLRRNYVHFPPGAEPA